MIEWNPVIEEPVDGRYLVKIECHHKFHSIAPINRQYPCHKINIAYYNAVHGWHFCSFVKWDPETQVTHWAIIPEFKTPVDYGKTKD